MNENFKVYATQKMRMNQLRLRLNTQQQPKYFVYVNEIFSQDTLYLSLSVDFALKKNCVQSENDGGKNCLTN